MSQSDFAVSGQTNGPELGVALPLFRNSIWSSHRGPVAPTYAIAGLNWIDDTGDPLWLRKVYDGTNWITAEAIDTTTNVAYPLTLSPKQSFSLAGGTANALTLTPAVPIAAYVDGDVGTFRAKFSNTGAATLNESGVGAKALRKIVAGTDVALAADDMLIGRDYWRRYSTAANSGAGAFILVNPSLQAALDNRVRFDAAQAMTDPEKLQARQNIGAIFTNEYMSSEQAIVSAGLVTLAHSLGDVPKLVTITLVCRTAGAGYVPGEVIDASNVFYGTVGTAVSKGATIITTSSSLNIRYADDPFAFAAQHKTTGVITGLANASWRMVVSAFA